MSARNFRLLALLYFASGMAGLIDEVAFFKYLSFTFGATAHASSAVLVSFMGGLAIGAFLASAFEGRVKQPLVVYGVIEIGVGIVCGLSPAMFGYVTKVYVSFASSETSSLATLQLVRSALASAVVMLPAIGMGATLPILARYVTALGGQRQLSILYGLNTAGGALGSLVCAYGMIPAFGLSTTMRTSAATSVLVGVVSLALNRDESRTTDATQTTTKPKTNTLDSRTSALVIASAASGLFVFASEVLFVHLLALVVGTSVYVFGLILFIFLVSLSIGAAIAPVFARRAGRAALPLSLSLSAIALAATIPLWDRLPSLFETIGPSVTSWAGRESIRALVAFAALLCPVACMGTAFPLVLQAASQRNDVGRIVGRLTALNTVASIGGSLLGGWALLPTLGSEKSLRVVTIGYALAAMLIFATSDRIAKVSQSKLHFMGPVISAVAILLLFALPRWNLVRLSDGANVYFEKQLPTNAQVIWVHEDVHGGVTTVTSAGSLRTLYTAGKFQGDNGFQMTAQYGFAHIPSMFVSRFDRALVIGLGTGTTLGALAAYPFETIDVAELSPAIVTAAGTYFTDINRNVLSDKRVHVLYEDGRNALLVRNGSYDLISIELSSIWFAGAANLYNREFYETAKTRLREGGILQQWIQLHHTTRREIATQIATCRASFPYTLFFIRGEQGILVASMTPLMAPMKRLEELNGSTPLRAILGKRHLAEHLDDLVLGDETMDRFLDDVARETGQSRDQFLSTDDNLKLEYATPRNNIPGLPNTYQMGDALRAYRSESVIAAHVMR